MNAAVFSVTKESKNRGNRKKRTDHCQWTGAFRYATINTFQYLFPTTVSYEAYHKNNKTAILPN